MGRAERSALRQGSLHLALGMPGELASAYESREASLSLASKEWTGAPFLAAGCHARGGGEQQGAAGQVCDQSADGGLVAAG